MLPRLPAWVPPSNQIALLGTLAIHPAYTNRPTEEEDVVAATQALKYLRALVNIVGPVNSNLRSAFLFTQASRGRRRGYGADPDFNGGDGDDSGEDDAIADRFADDSSVWARGQDFW